MDDRHYCDICKERIFRYGYNVNGKLYCNSCMTKTFMVKFDQSAYILPEQNKKAEDGETA